MNPLGGLGSALYSSPHQDSRNTAPPALPQGLESSQMCTHHVGSTTFGSGLRLAGGEPQASP